VLQMRAATMKQRCLTSSWMRETLDYIHESLAGFRTVNVYEDALAGYIGELF
jgi:hypothetical protein